MRKLTAKQLEKQTDKRIEAAYYAVAQGVQINIFDISKVFAVGKNAIEHGADDAALKTTIFEFVQTIRKN